MLRSVSTRVCRRVPPYYTTDHSPTQEPFKSAANLLFDSKAFVLVNVTDFGVSNSASSPPGTASPVAVEHRPGQLPAPRRRRVQGRWLQRSWQKQPGYAVFQSCSRVRGPGTHGTGQVTQLSKDLRLQMTPCPQLNLQRPDQSRCLARSVLDRVCHELPAAQHHLSE